MFRFASKKDLTAEFKCTINLLEPGESIECEFTRDKTGQFLLDYVYENLNLLEKDYFGLIFTDANDQKHWLEPTRAIIKQVKGMDPITFSFRVKFYCADPTHVKEEITRYYLYLQLKRDLLSGRLACNSSEAATLLAYCVQSELGDYDSSEHHDNYISSLKLIQNQTPKLEQAVMELHQKDMKGLSPAEAELGLLKKAIQLDTYGIHPHSVKDHKGNALQLGINYSGILTFQENHKTHHFKWNEIQKITYEGRMFIVHVITNDKKNLMGFKCPNTSTCQYLWRCAVEQRYFFTMSSSKEVPEVTTAGRIFSKSKLRYSGRVEKEIIDDMKSIDRKETTLTRSYSSLGNTRPVRLFGKGALHMLDDSVIPESPEKVTPYMNNSTFPEHEGNRNKVTNIATPSNLESFDEREWDMSMTSSLPTEFDLIPDITPTDDEAHSIIYETPEVHSSPSHNPDDKGRKKANQRKTRRQQICTILRTSLLSSLLLLLLLACLIILVIEVDSDMLSSLRKLPEMVALRRDYYEPMKESLWEQFNR